MTDETAKKILGWWPVIMAIICVGVTVVRAQSQITHDAAILATHSQDIKTINQVISDNNQRLAKLEQKSEDTNDTVHRIEGRMEK